MDKLYTNSKLKWFSLILKQLIGIEVEIKEFEEKLYLIKNNKEFFVFDNFEPLFYKIGGEIDCKKWRPESEGFNDLLNSGIPAPGLKVDKIFENKNSLIYCHYDILGLMYWVLNRIEEIDSKKLDKHGRFSFYESHAYRYNYIEYPIIDQWADILKQAFLINNKNINFETLTYNCLVTHDVDRPSRYYFSNVRKFVKATLGDLYKTRNLKNFVFSFSRFFSNNISVNDPYNTFDFIMKVSEKYNIISHFYFIGGGNTSYDADYDINSSEIKEIINNINLRGHIVGIHPSYNTYLDKEEMRQEFVALSEYIVDNRYTGRMHYLRFKYPETFRNLESNNMYMDSSLGYAEHIGFRAGTSKVYNPFDPFEDEIINILEAPLIVMDGTLNVYMGLSLNNETLNRVKVLIERCKIFNGNFVLLWHNSELYQKNQRDFYEKLVSLL